MMTNPNHSRLSRQLARAEAPHPRITVTQAVALAGTAVPTAEAIAAVARVRVLKHELQVALVALAGSEADAHAMPATHADISWVHDQVIERPYMAQVVSRWFRQVSRLSCIEVKTLRHVDALITEIEGLAAAGEGGLVRTLDALQLRVVDGEF